MCFNLQSGAGFGLPYSAAHSLSLVVPTRVCGKGTSYACGINDVDFSFSFTTNFGHLNSLHHIQTATDRDFASSLSYSLNDLITRTTRVVLFLNPMFTSKPPDAQTQNPGRLPLLAREEKVSWTHGQLPHLDPEVIILPWQFDQNLHQDPFE